MEKCLKIPLMKPGKAENKQMWLCVAGTLALKQLKVLFWCFHLKPCSIATSYKLSVEQSWKPVSQLWHQHTEGNQRCPVGMEMKPWYVFTKAVVTSLTSLHTVDTIFQTNNILQGLLTPRENSQDSKMINRDCHHLSSFVFAWKYDFIDHCQHFLLLTKTPCGQFTGCWM